MKSLIIILALFTMVQANAHDSILPTGFDNQKVDELALEQALEMATRQERKAYYDCEEITPEENCINQELGDIYN